MRRTAFSIVTALVLLVLAAAARPAGAEERHYVVKRGQTLSLIADDVLGDPDLWPAIYRANRDQIKDPMILHVGQRLAIPEVAASERARIRREAAAFAAPAPKPDGPDVAAAPPGPPRRATE
jgi:hypothetical protein